MILVFDAAVIHFWYCYLQTVSFKHCFDPSSFWNPHFLEFKWSSSLKFIKLLYDFFLWQITQNILLDFAAMWEIVPTSWKKFLASRKYKLRWF